jgi:hypothetical protein
MRVYLWKTNERAKPLRTTSRPQCTRQQQRQPPKKPGRKPGEKKAYGFVTQRIEKKRYEELQELFGGKGLAMATAANMALMYIAEMVEQGSMTISRGGIIDLRRR